MLLKDSNIYPVEAKDVLPLLKEIVLEIDSEFDEKNIIGFVNTFKGREIFFVSSAYPLGRKIVDSLNFVADSNLNGGWWYCLDTGKNFDVSFLVFTDGIVTNAFIFSEI